MNHSIQFLIFDLDGTLVDTRKDLIESTNWALAQMTYPQKTTKEILAAIGYGIRNLIKKCLPFEEQNNPIVLNQTLDLFKNHYSKHLTDYSTLYPGVFDFFNNLAQTKPLTSVVLTNKVEVYAREILNNLGLSPYISSVIGGDTLPTRKPDSRGIQKLLKDYSFLKSESLMIGDSVPDIEVAHNAGIRSVGILNGIGNTEDLITAKPDFIIKSFLEFPTLLKKLY